jgi:hypothetical protein
MLSAKRPRRTFAMDAGAGVKTNPEFPIPPSMKAWVLGNYGAGG